jgi:hypothetical protein
MVACIVIVNYEYTPVGLGYRSDAYGILGGVIGGKSWYFGRPPSFKSIFHRKIPLSGKEISLHF